MNYLKEREYIPRIMREAFSRIIEKSFFSQDYEKYSKGNNDVVTDCDIKVEEFIVNSIKMEFTGDTIISEELNSDNDIKARTWIIDPIDGTVNFSRGFKLFGIQICLVENKEPVFSTIFLPFLNEMYIASKGDGAFLNGERIRASKANCLLDSIVTFGDFTTRLNADNTRRNQIGVVNSIYNKVKKLKMFGAACVDFTSIASAKTDAHIIFTKNIWDLLPGYFLAIEAGASSNYDFHNPKEYVVVAANDSVLKEIIDSVGEIDE